MASVINPVFSRHASEFVLIPSSCTCAARPAESAGSRPDPIGLLAASRQFFNKNPHDSPAERPANGSLHHYASARDNRVSWGQGGTNRDARIVLIGCREKDVLGVERNIRLDLKLLQT
jgi:hypothetical protein